MAHDDSTVAFDGMAFERAMREALQKLGKIPLNDHELLLLACRELAGTYTRDETNYA